MSLVSLGPDQQHRSPIRRFDAIAGGPIWWGMHLGLLYWLVPRMCEGELLWPFHLATLALLALTARAWLSGVQLLRAGREVFDDQRGVRDVFLGWTGAVLSILFGLVIVAEWVPSFFISPCQ